MKPRLTYANVMSTIAVFLAMGGVGYAATSKSPVKFVQAPISVSPAKLAADGTLSSAGFGFANATCPQGFSAVGGGFIGMYAQAGALIPTTSSPSRNNPRQWLTWVENYSTSAQTAYASAVCVRNASL